MLTRHRWWFPDLTADSHALWPQPLYWGQSLSTSHMRRWTPNPEHHTTLSPNRRKMQPYIVLTVRHASATVSRCLTRYGSGTPPLDSHGRHTIDRNSRSRFMSYSSELLFSQRSRQDSNLHDRQVSASPISSRVAAQLTGFTFRRPALSRH